MDNVPFVALVTGGDRPIGQCIALRLAKLGYDVAVAGPDSDEVQVAALEIRGSKRRALPLLADVTCEKQVQAMVRKASQELGPIHLLVNNAAVPGPAAALPDISKKDWDAVLAVNLTGSFLCSKAVLPDMMQRRGGKIVNISPAAGHVARALQGPCAASKWGLIGLTQTLAREMGEYHIRVNAVCPGPVEDEWLAGMIRLQAQKEGRDEQTVALEWKKQTALGRFVRPEDIAEAVAFLASPAGDSITGQIIDVSAGFGL